MPEAIDDSDRFRPPADPAISVIVPVYNPGAYLQQLLESLLAQSEPSFEIVAVDDGSTDDSLAVLQRFAATDSRLKVFTQPNRGFSATRNAGIDHARGRWLSFADSDDWLAPGALQAWREHGERHDLEVVLGNGFRFSGIAGEAVAPTAQLVVEHAPPQAVFTGADWIEHSVASQAWHHVVWLQFIRRDLVVRHGLRFIEGIIHEDVPWSMTLGLCARRMGYLPRPLYGYRLSAGSAMADRGVDHLRGRARSYLIVMQQFKDAAHVHRVQGSLRRALLRQLQRESRNFLSLMRKGGFEAHWRHDLAREFLARRLTMPMFLGSDDLRSFWRALRGWIRLRLWARRHGRAGTQPR